MKRVIAASLGIVLLAAVTGLAQKKDPGLDQLIADYQRAWAKGDAKGLSALYTANAIRVADGQQAIGRPAIQQMFETNFGSIWKGTKVTITTGRTEALGTDVRLQEGTFEVTGASGPPLRGRFLNTVVREGGQWRIAGLAAMSQAPPK